MTSFELLTGPLERTAASAPDHPAVVMGDEVVSYGELDRRAAAVAATLIDRGVDRGDLVGLYAHKSSEVVAALFGIMRAGAAYVPINPDAPAAYARDIVAECGIRHLVTSPSRRRVAMEVAADTGIRSLLGVRSEEGDPVPAADWAAVFSAPPDPVPVPIRGDDLAYVIFTSGSTGRPKGIMHTHRSGLAYATAAADVYGFRSSDRITNHAPLNFDLSTLELFGGTVAGATIVMVPEGHARLPASFAHLLEDQSVTVVNAVPFALAQLLHRGALDERDLSAVRWVLFGGEVFPTKDLRELMGALPHARFANVYGPAEVNGCTYHVLDEPPEGDEPIPIGRLYPGMEALVVGDDDRPVPDGTLGELLIHSPTHMVGYWNQPELTERSRLRVPAPDGTERVWYRTGDLVAAAGDGTFRLSGRRDRQVQVRGNRVELDEVESAMASHPGVERAVVYAVPDDVGSHEVRAVVTLVDRELSGDDVRRHAARLLPRHALPRSVEIRDEVPETLSGKADRVALAGSAGSDQAEPDPTQRRP